MIESLIKKDAILDESRMYRYVLIRKWGNNEDNFVNFILLNPSRADERFDDPTIKACITFAQNWWFDGFYVTNLFAFRATKPKDLKKVLDPIGLLNNRHLGETAKKSKKVVIAWGNHGSFKERDKEVLQILTRICTPHCIQKLKNGSPKHPLYIKRDTKPIIF